MKLLLHTHELKLLRSRINDFWKETRKKIAVIEESYKRKYRVLQKAMQNCV